MITRFRALPKQQHKISLHSLGSFRTSPYVQREGALYSRILWCMCQSSLMDLTDTDSFRRAGLIHSGNMRSHTFNAAVRVLCTEDETYVLGPLTTPYMFVGGRKLRVHRDLRPYSNDVEYIVTLAASEREDTTIARCSST